MCIAHVEVVLDHPMGLCWRSSEAACNLGGRSGSCSSHSTASHFTCNDVYHCTERQIKTRKEQERRKKAREIHWCIECLTILLGL